MPAAVTQNSKTSSIRVDAIRIANFRSLRNIEVELGATTVLVGMNNSGKTSFLRALHLALGSDRRTIQPDDFFINDEGNESDRILTDVRLIPVNPDGSRKKGFDQDWIDADFGGDVISLDQNDQQFVAFRTSITHDAVTNDFVLDRKALPEWRDFQDWQNTQVRGRVPRFEQIASFFIDAQRDVVGDLRNRSSYLGKLLSKIEISPEAIAELEERLNSLNDDIVAKSEVLSHIRDSLASLNRTVPAFGQGVEVTPVSKKVRDITKGLGVQFSDSQGSSFPLESHGMGTRSWASLLTFGAYVSWTAQLAERQKLPFHPVLSLEEPEAHLHPNAQRSVYRQLSQGVGQRIVSTHSPYVAGQAELGEFVHFSKKGSETAVSRIPVAALTGDEPRKIRREIMRSRGELLFTRAVVLFEGETEEQALPMFARHHWSEYPFERGVAFVGVGGDGNYFPFLRTFESLGIPWFIFSDGEPASVTKVTSAVEKLGLTIPHPNVIILPNGKSIEGYLVEQGYQVALKTAFIEQHKPFQNAQHETAKRAEINGWTDDELKQFLKSNKTAMAGYWATAIIATGGATAVPVAIKRLLDTVSGVISPPPAGPATANPVTSGPPIP